MDAKAQEVRSNEEVAMNLKLGAGLLSTALIALIVVVLYNKLVRRTA